ncbi:MAG TPA: DsrE family protein [Euzebyales bacterium]|nr:DsrE family protein [Euzebyales bacterium]
MARRVVSIMSGAPAAVSPADPVLEANAYAVAEDVDLSVVLRGAAIEYAARTGEVVPARLAGRQLPNARCARDLRGLLESGVPVYVDGDGAADQGIAVDDLVEGVSIADGTQLTDLFHAADAVLHW